MGVSKFLDTKDILNEAEKYTNLLWTKEEINILKDIFLITEKLLTNTNDTVKYNLIKNIQDATNIIIASDIMKKSIDFLQREENK